MVLCVCIVVGALANKPAADDLSGPSTAFGVVIGCFVGVKDNDGDIRVCGNVKQLDARSARRSYDCCLHVCAP